MNKGSNSEGDYSLLTVFDEDETQRYHLNGKSTKETEEWMEKIRNAR